MFEVLFDPDSFFDERADDPSLLSPALVVAAVGVVGVVAAAYGSLVASRYLPANVQQFASVGLAVGAVVAVVAPFVGWAVFSLLFYGISGLYEGEGSYRDVLALAGYGYLPRVFGALVGLLLTYLTYRSLPPNATYQQFARIAGSSPYTTVSAVLNWVFVAWQGVVTTYAVKHARSLDRRHAVVSVWVPIGAYILLLVGAYVLTTFVTGGLLP